ncbi:hypothetical protein [Caballeronia sp. S22]|uniref:hypothetical protein n=1 Tax=Caballeronia sp. S22 TaxID=3137182 RepID=UPI0035307D1E
MDNDFKETVADPNLYRSCFELVYAACAIPAFFLIIDLWRGSPQLFHRSGALALFLVAVAQFKQLSKFRNKLLKNLIEVKEDKKISLLSEDYSALEWRIFSVGLYGTLVTAYGDVLVNWILSVK